MWDDDLRKERRSKPMETPSIVTLCHDIVYAVGEGHWAEAHELHGQLGAALAGVAPQEFKPVDRWQIIVGVKSETEDFTTTIESSGPTAAIAAMRAEGEVRAAHCVSDDAVFRTVVIGRA
jgi:hypothetical protein